MANDSTKFPLRFEFRVLLPVIGIMAVLLFATLWIVKERFNEQVARQTEESLRNANAAFLAFQKQRSVFLIQEYQNAANEPRVKGIALNSDRKTTEEFIAKGKVQFVDGTLNEDSLAGALTQGANPVSAYVRGRLPETTRRMLANHKAGEREPELASVLLRDLNQILEGPNIYDTRRFAKVVLRKETQKLLSQNPGKETLAQFNRMLLEDAFPREIPKHIQGLLEELGVKTIFITKKGELPVGATRDSSDNVEALTPKVTASIDAALAGDALPEIVQVGQQFYDVISVPIVLNKQTEGAITFVDLIGPELANEFRELTGTEVILLFDGHVIASTLKDAAQVMDVLNGFAGFKTDQGPGNPAVRAMMLRNKPFEILAGQIPSTRAGAAPSYLLLMSQEGATKLLEATQRALIMTGMAGMLFSSVIIWFLVKRITHPLRLLQAGAEAVGRGDFSHRVLVTSRDETGALADAFNQMTANLQTSRAQLEQTVETLKTTREQLLQSEKLSAVGEFVAGVTHELNNPLTAVIGFADLMKQMGANDRQRIYLENIVASAQRCHKIVQSLLSFARQHAPEKKPVDINELIENTLSFVQYDFRTSNITLRRKLAPDLPRVWADPNQLLQVYLNVVNNARHAMEDFRRSGELVITTEVVGNMVQARFHDNGPGISAVNLSKIFNPFFTTKPVGKGTGLGLSVSYGIIQEHGGTIRAESREGEGTTFIIELAAMTGAQITTAPTPPVNGSISRGAASGKCILVVDDERPILMLLETCLIQDGHDVDAVADGETAIRFFQEKRYDLILCDWKMPGLNGRQVYERIKAIDPEASRRMVFMTGDVVNESIRKFHEESGTACLSKPFSMDDLRGFTRKTLAGE
jgi:signal transduction histidine kinase